MSITRKHFYRFEYLKSEHWKDLRIAKLASVDAVCVRCGTRDLSNDVHHLRYRSLYDVELLDLVVLCRECHQKVHHFLDRIRDGEFKGENCHNEWQEFKDLWGPNPNNIPELRSLIVSMRTKGKLLRTPADKELCARTYTRDILLTLDTSEAKKYVAAAKSKGISVEEWFIGLARKSL